MRLDSFRQMIRRAAAAPDGQMLDVLATRLADAERANEMLRAKGYRPEAHSISAAAALVPAARPSAAPR